MLLVFPSGVWGQNTGSPQLEHRPAEPRKPAASGREIILDVQVTDRSGRPVTGLKQQDFTVLDDRDPQTILSFEDVSGETASSSASSAEIVLVVDAVNTSFQTITYSREQIRQFLLRNNGQLAHPVSLVVFSDAGTKIQNGSSRDGKALAALYDQYQTGLRSITRAQGFYGAAERYELSLKALTSLAAYEGKQPGRKLMLWFSPGWPLLSGPNVQLTGDDEQRIFNSIVETSTLLRRARVTVYAIDPLGLADASGVRISYYKEFLKGVGSPRRAVPADLGLEVLAVQTGGRVLNATNDITDSIQSCAADADAFYVLSFSARPADQANEYHSVAITVDKPAMTARTRTGYYAQP
jgi:VWFA-related protein